jgi:hypothetical protein
MTEEFQFLMLSAMYENGGNTTHRFLDGHPELFVYPFESQIGTRMVQDPLSSMFPLKYRWPVFALDATPEEDYRSIIDEETKVRARTPHVSKFRHVHFDFSDDERKDIYCGMIGRSARSRADNVAAFFRSTFEAWRDYHRSGRERVYVGYSPVIVIDAEKILRELPGAHVLHIVRNPWSAFADTKKRPVPLSLDHYMLGWTLNQSFAQQTRQAFPGRMHIVRIEDVMAEPGRTLGAVCAAIGVDTSETLLRPTWNGTLLEEVYPWGTLRRVTPQVNRATADELSADEVSRIRALAGPFLDHYDYKEFLG